MIRALRALLANLRHELVVSGLVVLAIVLIGQRYGRAQRDSVHTSTATRASYPRELEPVPDVTAGTFFHEQHERCFAQHYRMSWIWNRLDHVGYRGCLESAYAERLGRVLLLDRVADWEPTDVPPWARLTLTVRLGDGVLPRDPRVRVARQCARPVPAPPTPSPPSDAGLDGESVRGHLENMQKGVYQASIVELMHGEPCDAEVSFAYDRWLLSPPLKTQIPAQGSFDVVVEEPQIIPIF